MEVVLALCERIESAAECLHQDLVTEKLLAPVTALLTGQQVPLLDMHNNECVSGHSSMS